MAQFARGPTWLHVTCVPVGEDPRGVSAALLSLEDGNPGHPPRDTACLAQHVRGPEACHFPRAGAPLGVRAAGIGTR